MHFKKLALFSLLATFLFAFGFSLSANAKNSKDHKVAICHFDGHKSDTGRQDFVTTGRGCGCLNRGGEVLQVARKACENGHKASGNCNLNNIDRLDLESCNR